MVSMMIMKLYIKYPTIINKGIISEINYYFNNMIYKNSNYQVRLIKLLTEFPFDDTDKLCSGLKCFMNTIKN